MNLRLFCRYVCPLVVVVLLGVVSCCLIGGSEDSGSCGGAIEAEKYLASGEFYYWFPGMEMTSGRGDWGGPDPIWLFTEEIWNLRGTDFNDRVWDRMVNEHHWLRKLHRPQFDEAIGTVRIGHSGTAITWGRVCAISTGPCFASDLVNSCMDELYCAEKRIKQDKTNKVIEGWEQRQFSYWKSIQRCKRMLKTERKKDMIRCYSNELAHAETAITNLEARIEEFSKQGASKQLQYKLMRRATPPKEPVTARELKALEKCWK